MAVYTTNTEYLDTATDLKDKIVKLNTIISAMYTTAEKAAGNADIEEYWLDDGQTKIKNIYRSPEDIIKAIKSYERLRQMYIQRLNNSGSVVLRDLSSNTTKRNHGY